MYSMTIVVLVTSLALAGLQSLLSKIWPVKPDAEYERAVKEGKTSDFHKLVIIKNSSIFVGGAVFIFGSMYLIWYLLEVHFSAMFPDPTILVDYADELYVWILPLIFLSIMVAGSLANILIGFYLRERNGYFKTYVSLKKKTDESKLNKIAAVVIIVFFVIWSVIALQFFIAFDNNGIRYGNLSNIGGKYYPYTEVTKIGRQTMIKKDGRKFYNLIIYLNDGEKIDLDMLRETQNPSSYDERISRIQRVNPSVPITQEEDRHEK